MPNSDLIDIESLSSAFRARLGPPRWLAYREMLTQFLVGKLSRSELVRGLREQLQLENADLRRHNSLVLALLANASRAPPLSASRAPNSNDGHLIGGSPARGQLDVRESREQRLFRDVLALPARERRRIKAIAQETPSAGGLPLLPPPLPVLLAARHAMLPHLPYLPDTRARLAPKGINARIVPDKTAAASSSAPSAKFAPPSIASSSIAPSSIAQTSVAPPSIAPPSIAQTSAAQTSAAQTSAAQTSKESVSPLHDPLLNLTPGRASGPLTWTQDIIQGLEAPLMAETHELPDDALLGPRMLEIALENGLLQGIGAGATDIMLLGLESYLRRIVAQLTSQCHRQIRSDSPLAAADLDLLLRAQPAELGEHMAPAWRLRTRFLRDEPTVEPHALPDPETGGPPAKKRRESPWDLGRETRARQETWPESVERRLREHENGRALASSLLSGSPRF